MPRPTNSGLIHKAVLWSVLGGADEFGNDRVGAAEEIDCRWVWGTSLVSEAEERTKPITATVVVDQEIPIGSILRKGTIDEWNKRSGESPTNLMQVVSYDETPDVRGRRSRKSVTLSKYSGVLPNAI